MIATNSQFPRIIGSDEEPSYDLFERAVLALESMAQTQKEILLTQKEIAAYMNGQKRAVATEAQALALLIEIGPKIAEIAERLGVHRATLYRWPKFMEQVGRVRRAGLAGGQAMRVVRDEDEGDDE